METDLCVKSEGVKKTPDTCITVPFIVSPFLCSNKLCSTLRICLIMTRSASPLPSPWLRTSWIFPTAAVKFYWVTWESTASWNSMVLYPKTQMALQGQTKTATEGFVGLLQAECCGPSLLWAAGTHDWIQILRLHQDFNETCSCDTLRTSVMVHSSIFRHSWRYIFTRSTVSLLLELLRESGWINWFHLSFVVSCFVWFKECIL